MSLRDIKQQAVYGGIVVRELEKWRLAFERAEGRKPDGYWHPSSVSGCPTASVYEYLCFPKPGAPHDARLLRIFDTGHAVHHMLQHQFTKAGMLAQIAWPVDIIKKEGDKEIIVHKQGTVLPAVELPILDEHYRLRGTLDVIFNIKQRFVGELKTKHSSSFAKMTDAQEDHKFQVACYHWKAADFGWVDVDWANMIYFSKDDAHMREFKVPVTPERITTIKGKLDTMNNMVSDYRNLGTIPEPYYKEPQKPPCRTCQWAQACHATMSREAWIKQIKERTNAQPPCTPQEAKDVLVSDGVRVPSTPAIRKLPVRKQG